MTMRQIDRRYLFALLLAGIQLVGWAKDIPPASFANPICEQADPWIVRYKDKYLACFSESNRAISIHISDRLTSLGPKNLVWSAPEKGPASREVWAPELHLLGGRWYIYFAASDGQNRNHHAWVLESAGEHPLGPYTLHGPLYTGDDPEMAASNHWAIDMTILELGSRSYAIWSGWPDEQDLQYLYIAPMKDPLTLSAPRTRLCGNDDYTWERVGERAPGRGLNEAPEVLQHGGRLFVTYSCSGSWQTSYKIGLLELRPGGDPLNPRDWKKYPKPIFRSSARTFGVGHNSFTTSPDGKEDWLVYHAKADRKDGWHRLVFCQRFSWDGTGLPLFGAPVAAGQPLPLPSGETLAPGAISSASFSDPPGAADPPKSSYTNPVYAASMPDPSVIRYDDYYYAAGTTGDGRTPDGRIFTLLRSKTLVNWERLGGALKPPFQDAKLQYWAPELTRNSGKYYLYYCVGGDEPEKFALRVSASDKPEGPYLDLGLQLVDCESNRFTIDPFPFRDDDGQWYFFYARNFTNETPEFHPGTAIVVDRLLDMTRLAGDCHVVVRAQQDWTLYEAHRRMDVYGRTFDWHTIEGPCVVKHAGRYYCFYSGANWQTPRYGVDYVVADSPLGPYCEGGDHARVLHGIPDHVRGPGHHSIVFGPDGKTQYVLYHAWDVGMKERQMCADKLQWTPNGPRCEPTDTPQPVP